MGTFPKKEANLSASMVAEVTTSFRSERRATTYGADERNNMEGTFMHGCGAVFILTETMAQDRASVVLQWLCMPGNTDALWSVQLKRPANLSPGKLNPAKTSAWAVLTFSQQDSGSITGDLTPPKPRTRMLEQSSAERCGSSASLS